MDEGVVHGNLVNPKWNYQQSNLQRAANLIRIGCGSYTKQRSGALVSRTSLLTDASGL
jgi:hypothetical protein